MNSFETFLEKLLNNPTTETVVTIRGKERKLKAMVRLCQLHYIDGDDYIKVIFDDGAFLLIILSEKEFYYADTFLGVAEGITDEMIGNKTLVFRDKEFALDNANDYQFVKQLYVGSPLDIEGECVFYDYFPTDGSKEFLSLGWLSYGGKRADLWSELIDPSVVKMI